MECLVPKYTQKSGESLAILFVTTNTKVSEADVLHVKTRMLSRRQIFSEITKLAISRFRLPTHKVPNFQSSIAISRFLGKFEFTIRPAVNSEITQKNRLDPPE